MRMHTLAVMHRSAKIKMPIYTTDNNILGMASIHCIIRHLNDVQIHIDGSLHL